MDWPNHNWIGTNNDWIRPNNDWICPNDDHIGPKDDWVGLILIGLGQNMIELGGMEWCLDWVK